MKDTMRGLFFIVKGQYKKVEPSFTNEVTGDKSYIGGYDPESDTTSEWYMLLDNKTFHCVACDKSLDKVLNSVKSVIKRYKGVAKGYFKHVSDTTSDDYYDTHYLGRKCLSHDQRTKKAEGRCPRVSPTMRCLYEHIFSVYGDYYTYLVEEMEDLAYLELKEERPFNKTRKLMTKKKNRIGGTGLSKIPLEKKEEKVLDTSKLVRPKKRLGIKKLSMGS